MAVLPDGTAKPLLRIANWDFRWQHVFRLVTPLALPKGTTLTMNYVYDNSADNPRNPVLPPRRVFWGQRSGDEMGDLWIQVLTHNDRDLSILGDAFNRKVMAEDVIGYERWVESEPKSTALRDDLGSLYLKLNRPNDAVRHFAISAGLNPSAQASFNLATALTVAGQVTAAVQQYERALELRPDYAAAHTNLGSLLLQQGKSDLALVHLREALRLDPSSIQAHFSAGIALEQAGQWEEAIAHMRRVLEAQGDLPEALSNLAWMLAVTADDRLRNPGEAARLAERAAALTGGRDPVALDVLAAAHASGGAFDRAVDAANAALALNPSNAADIIARRDLYVSRRPYRQAR
jgi:tetratricopeptide (TPR) repeat protein